MTSTFNIKLLYSKFVFECLLVSKIIIQKIKIKFIFKKAFLVIIQPTNHKRLLLYRTTPCIALNAKHINHFVLNMDDVLSLDLAKIAEYQVGQPTVLSLARLHQCTSYPGSLRVEQAD